MSVYMTLCGLTASIASTALHGSEIIPSPKRVYETKRHMGVEWKIMAYSTDNHAALEAIRDAHDEISRLEQILSDYDPESELVRVSSQAQTAAPIQISRELWEVLNCAVKWQELTKGAFDPTIGPLTKLWRQSRRSGVMPRPEKLKAAKALVGPELLHVHSSMNVLSLKRPGMRLDLGGIGMGIAADRAVDVLRKHHITSGMIDASGDITVIGSPPGRDNWQIAVQALGKSEGRLLTVGLSDAAITTSGDAFQSVTINGVRYSHIVDPRTGLGVKGPAAVTVIAQDCTTADVLATAASVLGPEEGMSLIRSMPHTAARFVWEDTSGLRHTVSSANWPNE